MDKAIVVKQLCEFYGIPPHHNTDKQHSSNIEANLQGAFGKPLEDIEKELGFTRVRDFHDAQMRRVGKEVTALIKQIIR